MVYPNKSCVCQLHSHLFAKFDKLPKDILSDYIQLLEEPDEYDGLRIKTVAIEDHDTIMNYQKSFYKDEIKCKDLEILNLRE